MTETGLVLLFKILLKLIQLLDINWLGGLVGIC